MKGRQQGRPTKWVTATMKEHVAVGKPGVKFEVWEKWKKNRRKLGTLAVTVDATPSAARTAHLVLKQTGTRLTGTLGPNDHDQSTTIKGQLETIRKNGKDVTNVTLDLTPGSGTALRFAMTFVAGRLKGTAQAISDGHAIAAVLDVTRAK